MSSNHVWDLDEIKVTRNKFIQNPSPYSHLEVAFITLPYGEWHLPSCLVSLLISGALRTLKVPQFNGN